MAEITTEDGFSSGQKDDVKFALAGISAKRTRVQTYCDYYDGKHPFNFASEKFRTQFAIRLQKFRDNLCKTVVRAPSDRLEVVGFSSERDTQTYKDSWELWKYSNMARLSKRLHRDAFKTGDAYLIVWEDEAGRPRFYPQDARNCAVVYNAETQKIERGAKLWVGNDKFVYLTLYYPDRIEKYVTRNRQSEGTIPTTSAAFERRKISGEPWPLPNPLDVCPMFHFGNESSILDDVIPLNDALNKELADLLIGSESNSLRQRWSAGITYEVDPETGKQIIPWSREAQYVGTENESAKFGEFADVSLTNFLAVVQDFRAEIATVSGVPSYYFRLESGNLPSGETLRKAETRFTNLIKDAQLDFGEVWADAMRFALRLDEKNGEGIETQWSPADPMSETELVNLAIQKKQIGVSNKQNLSEVGYTDADIERMAAEKSAETAAAGEAFSKVFDAGTNLSQ